MNKFKKIDSILYVEDEKAIQEELSDVLQYFCEELFLANNGENGLELYKKHNPSLIITDIQMPIMSGIELSKAIKELNPDVPIIFTTAFTDSKYMHEAISLQADGYVVKPIDLDLLEDTIHKCIKIYRLQEEITQKTKYELQEKDDLETILSTTKDGIAMLDLKSKYLYANESYQDMLGYSLSELKEQSYIADDDVKKREEFAEVFEKIINEGYINNFEKQHVRTDGRVITVSASAALMPDKNRILLATRDITKDIYTKNLLQEYLNLVDEHIITATTDLKGTITYASKAFWRITGYSQEELIGKLHSIVRHEDMPNEIYEEMWRMLQVDGKWIGELKNKKKNGDHYWVYAKIYPINDEYGKKIGYTAIHQNITDLKRVEELSVRDALTGIYNRRHFNEIFPKFINTARRKDEVISFAILDIDYFKQYNDTYGHQKGDEALVKVTNVINNSLHRSDDYFFRVGGEEFALLFKTSTKEQSKGFIQTILESVESLKIAHKQSTVSKYVTVSIGFVTVNAKAIKNGDSLYQQADALLYEAKHNGRNQVSYAKSKVKSE